MKGCEYEIVIIIFSGKVLSNYLTGKGEENGRSTNENLYRVTLVLLESLTESTPIRMISF